MTLRRHNSNGLDGLGMYLKEIGQYPVLGKAEEIALAQRIERGDAEARQTFIKCNLRLVVWHAKRRNTAGSISMMDLIQEGNCGLLRAVELFDWRKGFKFSTYASWWIQQKMQRGNWQQSRMIRLPAFMQVRVDMVGRVSEELLTELHRPATPSELSTHANLTIGQIEEVLTLLSDTLSLDAVLDQEEKGSTLEEIIASGEDDQARVDDVYGYDFGQQQLVDMIQESVDTVTAGIIIRRFGLGQSQTQDFNEIASSLNMSSHRVAQMCRHGLRLLLLARPEQLKSLHDYVCLEDHLTEASGSDTAFRVVKPVTQSSKITWAYAMCNFLLDRDGVFEAPPKTAFYSHLARQLEWERNQTSQTVHILRDAGLITVYTRSTNPNGWPYKIELTPTLASS